MDVFRGGVLIAEWPEPRTIEIIPMKQLAEIRLTMTYRKSKVDGPEFEALRIAKEALCSRNVFFQEIRTLQGRVLSIPTLKTGDPINFLRYALGMRVVLQDRYIAPFSLN